MKITPQDNQFMRRAIVLALQAEREGNLLVGALITLDGRIIAEGRSDIWVPDFDATRHAEMQALRTIPKHLWHSPELMSLYTTLEPCLMYCGPYPYQDLSRLLRCILALTSTLDGVECAICVNCHVTGCRCTSGAQLFL